MVSTANPIPRRLERSELDDAADFFLKTLQTPNVPPPPKPIDERLKVFFGNYAIDFISKIPSRFPSPSDKPLPSPKVTQFFLKTGFEAEAKGGENSDYLGAFGNRAFKTAWNSIPLPGWSYINKGSELADIIGSLPSRPPTEADWERWYEQQRRDPFASEHVCDPLTSHLTQRGLYYFGGIYRGSEWTKRQLEIGLQIVGASEHLDSVADQEAARLEAEGIVTVARGTYDILHQAAQTEFAREREDYFSRYRDYEEQAEFWKRVFSLGKEMPLFVLNKARQSALLQAQVDSRDDLAERQADQLLQDTLRAMPGQLERGFSSLLNTSFFQNMLPRLVFNPYMYAQIQQFAASGSGGGTVPIPLQHTPSGSIDWEATDQLLLFNSTGFDLYHSSLYSSWAPQLNLHLSPDGTLAGADVVFTPPEVETAPTPQRRLPSAGSKPSVLGGFSEPHFIYTHVHLGLSDRPDLVFEVKIDFPLVFVPSLDGVSITINAGIAIAQMALYFYNKRIEKLTNALYDKIEKRSDALTAASRDFNTGSQQLNVLINNSPPPPPPDNSDPIVYANWLRSYDIWLKQVEEKNREAIDLAGKVETAADDLHEKTGHPQRQENHDQGIDNEGLKEISKPAKALRDDFKNTIIPDLRSLLAQIQGSQTQNGQRLQDAEFNAILYQIAQCIPGLVPTSLTAPPTFSSLRGIQGQIQAYNQEFFPKQTPSLSGKDQLLWNFLVKHLNGEPVTNTELPLLALIFGRETDVFFKSMVFFPGLIQPDPRNIDIIRDWVLATHPNLKQLYDDEVLDRKQNGERAQQRKAEHELWVQQLDACPTLSPQLRQALLDFFDFIPPTSSSVDTADSQPNKLHGALYEAALKVSVAQFASQDPHTREQNLLVLENLMVNGTSHVDVIRDNYASCVKAHILDLIASEKWQESADYITEWMKRAPNLPSLSPDLALAMSTCLLQMSEHKISRFEENIAFLKTQPKTEQVAQLIEINVKMLVYEARRMCHDIFLGADVFSFIWREAANYVISERFNFGDRSILVKDVINALIQVATNPVVMRQWLSLPILSDHRGRLIEELAKDHPNSWFNAMHVAAFVAPFAHRTLIAIGERLQIENSHWHNSLWVTSRGISALSMTSTGFNLWSTLNPPDDPNKEASQSEAEEAKPPPSPAGGKELCRYVSLLTAFPTLILQGSQLFGYSRDLQASLEAYPLTHDIFHTLGSHRLSATVSALHLVHRIDTRFSGTAYVANVFQDRYDLSKEESLRRVQNAQLLVTTLLLAYQGYAAYSSTHLHRTMHEAFTAAQRGKSQEALSKLASIQSSLPERVYTLFRRYVTALTQFKDKKHKTFDILLMQEVDRLMEEMGASSQEKQRMQQLRAELGLAQIEYCLRMGRLEEAVGKISQPERIFGAESPHPHFVYLHAKALEGKNPPDFEGAIGKLTETARGYIKLKQRFTDQGAESTTLKGMDEQILSVQREKEWVTIQKLLRENKVEEAEPRLEKAKVYEPRAHLKLALLSENKKPPQLEKTVEHLQKGMADYQRLCAPLLSPRREEEQALLKYYQMSISELQIKEALLFIQQEKYAEAFEKIKKIKNASPSAYYTFAQIFKKLGQGHEMEWRELRKLTNASFAKEYKITPTVKGPDNFFHALLGEKKEGSYAAPGKVEKPRDQCVHALVEKRESIQDSLTAFLAAQLQDRVFSPQPSRQAEILFQDVQLELLKPVLVENRTKLIETNQRQKSLFRSILADDQQDRDQLLAALNKGAQKEISLQKLQEDLGLAAHLFFSHLADVAAVLRESPLKEEFIRLKTERSSYLEREKTLLTDFVKEPAVFNAYRAACLNPDYQFTIHEVGMISELLGLNVRCFVQLEDDFILEQGTYGSKEPTVTILCNEFGYFSRCEQKVPSGPTHT